MLHTSIINSVSALTTQFLNSQKIRSSAQRKGVIAEIQEMLR
jgi:hypothetical protein